MSTLAFTLAGDIAPAESTKAKAGFWSRWVAVREARANARVRAHLAAMGPARLAALGFTADEIGALQSGEWKLPSGKKGE